MDKTFEVKGLDVMIVIYYKTNQVEYPLLSYCLIHGLQIEICFQYCKFNAMLITSC